MLHLTIERIVLIFVIMWLFDLLPVNPNAKHITNAVVAILLVIFGFVLV